MNSREIAVGRGLAGIAKSRFCLWLFLSTEVMFFVALIGSYVVLRSALPREEWPSQSAVGLHPWIGAVNTAILLLSSFFITRAVTSSRRDRAVSAKWSLVFALALGILFLVVKGLEYREKFEIGLYPRRQTALVYPRPDTDYLAAVQAEISRSRQAVPERQSADEPLAEGDRLALLDRLHLGLGQWASREFGQATDGSHREQALRDLAQMIRPIPNGDEQSGERIRVERDRLVTERMRLSESKQRVEQELEQGGRQLQELAGDESASESRAALEREQADLRAELSTLNTDWLAADHRLQVLQMLSDSPEGINARYDLCLPIVIPGGRTWLYGYYLLTGVHALHLLAGILVAFALTPFRLGIGRSLWLGNVALYWNFVDAVWLVLFPIIYLS